LSLKLGEPEPKTGGKLRPILLSDLVDKSHCTGWSKNMLRTKRLWFLQKKSSGSVQYFLRSKLYNRVASSLGPLCILKLFFSQSKYKSDAWWGNQTQRFKHYCTTPSRDLYHADIGETIHWI